MPNNHNLIEAEAIRILTDHLNASGGEPYMPYGWLQPVEFRGSIRGTSYDVYHFVGDSDPPFDFWAFVYIRAGEPTVERVVWNADAWLEITDDPSGEGNTATG